MSRAPWLCAFGIVGALQATAQAAPTSAAQPSAQPVQAKEAAKGSFLDEPTATQPDQPRSVAQAVGMALVVGMMAVGGCVAYGWAHSRRGPKVSGDKINLLAYKALGGRQRLALVEVCGERLLLSANEREVTLLSHLPGAPEVEDVQEAAASLRAQAPAEASSYTQRPASAPQTVAALEEALAQQNVATDAQSEAPATAFSGDLAGLHRWQAHAQAERRA